MKRFYSFVVVLALSGFATDALGADDKKEQWLRNCIWEVERTMVLYRAIRENGYGGKLETGKAEALKKRQINREGDIADSLLQLCMGAGGYRYDYWVGGNDMTCTRPDLSGPVLGRTSHCWEPIP